MPATVFRSRGLKRAEAKCDTSYQPGDIATFRKSEKDRPRAGTGYRLDALAKTGSVRLFSDKGKAHEWQPAGWDSARAEVFVEVE